MYEIYRICTHPQGTEAIAPLRRRAPWRRVTDVQVGGAIVLGGLGLVFLGHAPQLAGNLRGAREPSLPRAHSSEFDQVFVRPHRSTDHADVETMGLRNSALGIRRTGRRWIDG